MDNIIEPNETFDFSKLSLAHPSGIQGGAYFTKIENNKKPLYIQTSKSQTRQGFVKTGKKYYCDLMFDKNAEGLIHWFENLETRCQQLIFERRDTWFQNSLEESDIESAFNSTIRVYKSGKFYLVRTNIKNNHNNLPTIKIYNESEIPLTMDDIKPETNIISILEIQGIKFTSRNFQIEIELKQIMVLDDGLIFDNCLIKNGKKPLENIPVFKEELKPLEDIKFDEIGDNDESNNENIVFDLNNNNNLEEVTKSQETIIENNLEELESFDIDMSETEQLRPEEKDENISLDLEIEELKEDIEENTDELREVNNLDISLENNLETMQLKKPNQVYFELYKEARNKAKIAKKNALLAYLEAKNIKKTYLIENLNDSDSDIDAEIDDVSESELEGL
jgi:hypothetical protein